MTIANQHAVTEQELAIVGASGGLSDLGFYAQSEDHQQQGTSIPLTIPTHESMGDLSRGASPLVLSPLEKHSVYEFFKEVLY
jgi:hypothetical protein